MSNRHISRRKETLVRLAQEKKRLDDLREYVNQYKFAREHFTVKNKRTGMPEPAYWFMSYTQCQHDQYNPTCKLGVNLKNHPDGCLLNDPTLRPWLPGGDFIDVKVKKLFDEENSEISEDDIIPKPNWRYAKSSLHPSARINKRKPKPIQEVGEGEKVCKRCDRVVGDSATMDKCQQCVKNKNYIKLFKKARHRLKKRRKAEVRNLKEYLLFDEGDEEDNVWKKAAVENLSAYLDHEKKFEKGFADKKVIWGKAAIGVVNDMALDRLLSFFEPEQRQEILADLYLNINKNRGVWKRKRKHDKHAEIPQLPNPMYSDFKVSSLYASERLSDTEKIRLDRVMKDHLETLKISNKIRKSRYSPQSRYTMDQLRRGDEELRDIYRWRVGRILSSEVKSARKLMETEARIGYRHEEDGEDVMPFAWEEEEE